MELFIRIKNGQPFEHPIHGDNFCLAFPHVDVNNLPPEFARFERVERPELGEHEVLDPAEPTYELVNNIYKDVWHKRDMTQEEKNTVKQAKIAAYRQAWALLPHRENFSAWILNEETILYEPPIPRPKPDQTKLDAGIYTMWCGADANWKDSPAKPVDNNQYKFNFLTWQWVAVVN